MKFLNEMVNSISINILYQMKESILNWDLINIGKKRIIIKGNLIMVNLKVEGKCYLLMVIFMKVNLLRVLLMEREDLLLRMEMYMKEIGLIT